MQPIFAFVVALFTVVFTLTDAAPSADLVASLPGFTGRLPSLHYSGYLQALNGSFLHYYLVEATDVSPASAPVVLWMNGGPGCSSMDGWGYELGPFHFKGFNSTGPAFSLNQYTYARLANVVFLEAPPGVGFSYREDGDYNISDTLNAANNLEAVLSLLAKFPEYRSNRFVVAGESYGGIYVPTLVEAILNYNEAPSTAVDARVNLSGMMVGNGVTDADYDSNLLTSDLPFAYGHGLIPKSLNDATRDACIANPNGSDCNRHQMEFFELVGYNNMYGVYYKCFMLPRQSWKHVPALRRRLEREALQSHNGDVDALISAANKFLDEHKKTTSNEDDASNVPPSPSGGDVPCIDSRVMEAYLNQQDVKAALHVESSLTFHICYNLNYTSNVPSVVHVYKRLLALGIPTLVYNGDTDMAVPYTGTEGWLATLSLNVSTAFKTWRFDDASYVFGKQLGGYATGFEENKLWFVRVLGAGHMVPQFRPAAAFDMFSRFISGTGF